MIETMLPLVPELHAPAPAPDHVPLLERVVTLRRENAALCAENAALRVENGALQARVRELEARVGQNSSNSSRPPSSDPPQAPRKRPAQPSGRKRGGQPGHRGAFRRLLPVEEVDEVVVVVPEGCRHCGQRLPEPVGRQRGRVWRHQVVELLPLAVRVTEYQMAVRRCPACGKRTRAELPATAPASDPAPLLEQVATLRRENAALRVDNAVLQERVRELEARLGQNSTNSSRPPSSDPPRAPVRLQAPPSGRKRGGQPGHRGAYRALLPVEQVDAIVAMVPECCRHCERPFPPTTAGRRGRVWRHQVVELLPLAVQVTEYQMQVRRCPACGKRTRTALPPGVPRRPFGTRLTAVIALLSGRYRLSRREVRQLLRDLWQVRVSLGAVVRQEQAQSAALAPAVDEARAAVQEAAVVIIDETGWRQEKQRAWLWTAVTATLTVFRIDRSRGGAVLEPLLGSGFAGVVGSDRWSAYHRFPAERRALCYAHLKRDFQALVDRGGEAERIGRWGLAEIERLFTLWHVRPGRETAAQASDRQKGRREVLPRRCTIANARRPCDAQVPLPRRAKG
jgi:transposase